MFDKRNNDDTNEVSRLFCTLLQEKKMKKLITLLMTALLACLFAACDEDETTQLRWENQSGDQTAEEIKWVSDADSTAYDYAETLTADGQKTAFREIDSKDLKGTGECVLDGVPGEIMSEVGKAIILPEGQSSTYEIRSVAKK